MASRLYPTQKIRSKIDYFALSFSADSEGKSSLDGQTIWTGFADKEKRIELRKFSLVHPKRMADCRIRLGQPFMVVNIKLDFLRWFGAGGHALVNKKVIEVVFPDALKPSPCVQVGWVGF